MDSDTDFKNALPGEVQDHHDSGMPRQLRTRADGARPLSRAEAEVAGLTTTPQTVYGDDDFGTNGEDQADVHSGSAQPD